MLLIQNRWGRNPILTGWYIEQEIAAQKNTIDIAEELIFYLDAKVMKHSGKTEEK